MKKLIALLLALVMVLSLVACGNNDKPVDTNDNSETQDTTISNSSSDNTTSGDNNNTFDGTVTEKVVREYKVASEADFTYEESPTGIRITGYIGKDTIVVIPEKIAGQKVVAMTIASFGNDTKSRGVLIPSGVTELEGTFSNNTNVEVVIWESAEVAGANLFNNCTSLHTVVFGDKLTSIGENAFAACSSLKELYIPASVQNIDSYIAPTIFFWCNNLTILGEAGSYIESFCTEQGLTFKAK